MRLTALAILLLVFVGVRGVDLPDDIKARFDAKSLSRIEGVWAWTSGALVSIESGPSGEIALTLIDCADPCIDVPMKIGSGTPTGNSDQYDITLITMSDATRKNKKPESFRAIAKIADDNRLVLTPYSNKLKLNLYRLIPYFFRFSVSRQTPPTSIDGATRIWPPSGSPEYPVIL